MSGLGDYLYKTSSLEGIWARLSWTLVFIEYWNKLIIIIYFVRTHIIELIMYEQ